MSKVKSASWTPQMKSSVTAGWFFSLLVVTTLAVAISTANADDGNIQVGGYASQGYLKTTGNQYLLPKSLKGSPEFFEGAVHFMTNPTDKLHIGVQIAGRDFGDDGNNRVNVDWAYGDYRFRDFLGVRAGLTKIPLGLHNQYRDIDMARNWVFLPQSLYSEGNRSFQLAVEGASLYGNVGLDRAGDFDYEVYWGVSTHRAMDEGFTQPINRSIAGGVSG